MTCIADRACGQPGATHLCNETSPVGQLFFHSGESPHTYSHVLVDLCYIFRLLLHLSCADYHWDCFILLSQSIHKVLTLIIVPLYRNLLYPCTIQSDSSLSVQYNLLQVQLSLVDAHRPLLSLTYTSIYDDRYINCTTRTLGP